MKGPLGIAVFVCASLIFTAHAQQTNYSAVGVVKSLDPDGKTVVVQHAAISNYMPAMTMPFEVHDTNLLRDLKPGDSIKFTLAVTAKEGWIDALTWQSRPAPTTNTTPATFGAHGFQISSAVPELDVGDSLPDYHFTNELGDTVHLADYKGSVVAFTFFFTSCPFPNFCPRLTSNFSEAATELAQATNAPPKWHLLSVSFDPKTDTPDRLLFYAKNNAHYDPAHWTFLTGDIEQITELADQFGENFWTEGGSISHNLRTVVIDPHGKIRKIYKGNLWVPAQLVEEMAKAASE